MLSLLIFLLEPNVKFHHDEGGINWRYLFVSTSCGQSHISYSYLSWHFLGYTYNESIYVWFTLSSYGRCSAYHLIQVAPPVLVYSSHPYHRSTLLSLSIQIGPDVFMLDTIGWCMFLGPSLVSYKCKSSTCCLNLLLRQNIIPCCWHAPKFFGSGAWWINWGSQYIWETVA